MRKLRSDITREGLARTPHRAKIGNDFVGSSE